MPLCSRCGREIKELGKTGQGICPTCGIVSLSAISVPSKVSQGTAPIEGAPRAETRRDRGGPRKVVLIGLVIVILVSVGYLVGNRVFVPPLPTITPTETPARTSTPTLTPTPTPVGTDDARIREMVSRYYDAFNKHWTEGYLSFFVDDGQKLYNHGRDGTYTGHKSIGDQLSLVFLVYLDIVASDIKITGIKVDGNAATVQCEYTATSEKRQYKELFTESMELLKVDSAWKIMKTDLVSH